MDTPAKEYFLSRRPEAEEERKMYNRVITSLARRDLTMQALCEMSEKDLKRVRGIGEGSRAIIMAECENYRILPSNHGVDSHNDANKKACNSCTLRG